MSTSLQLDWQVQTFTGPEPLAPADLRSSGGADSWLRIDFTDSDTVLSGLISQCRLIAEQITGKSFAPQTIQAIWTMPQVNAGSLSGFKLLYDQDFYQYNESLGANPFSPAPFELLMPQPPLVAVSLFEYRITVFNPWQTWPASVNGVPNYVADNLPTPGIVYLQYPPPAYQYRLTFTAGYTTLPVDLKLALMQFIAWKYENRSGEDMPAEIQNQLMGNKSWVL